MNLLDYERRKTGFKYDAGTNNKCTSHTRMATQENWNACRFNQGLCYETGRIFKNANKSLQKIPWHNTYNYSLSQKSVSSLNLV